MSFRRASTVRYGPWVQACIDILDPPSISHIGDRRLAAWIRLQRLAEESLAMVGVGSDETSSTVNPSDPRTRLILRGGLERVEDWRRNMPDDIMTLTLDIHYHVILLNFCEPGLYNNHGFRDFRPPYAIHTLLSANAFAQDTPQYVDARIECLDVARKLIELFLQLSPEMLRQVPIIVFTRMMYAVVTIIKLEVFNRPNHISDMSGTEPVSALNLMRLVLDKLKSASDGGRFLSPATFHAVLSRLHNRCVESYWSLNMGHNEIIKPLMNLQVEESSKDRKATPQGVHREHLMPKPQVLNTEHMSPGMGTSVFPEPSISLGGYLPDAPVNAGAQVFWNSFFSDEFLPIAMERDFSTGVIDL
ncbi:hypothetical protein NW762_011624 [Fusarium torreyae]|uniref:Transcription factor n=1 Tax=Fusarium torreyae TaxID=1237075 RepID=A0A9W8RSN5_9HYPO|nr:hypothetical protein NW762_011624 [Fusarium torreyae]